ncbi:MAG: gliding motility-associated C-terminal domain-containing protein [Flavobacteriales bacterium]
MNRSKISNVYSPIPIHMEPRWRCVRELGLILLLLFPVVLRATVLEPPSLRCASVGAAGSAVLTWTVPPDPTAEFLHYEVYHAASFAGPYTLVAPVPVYAQTTYTHLGAGANAAAQYYYLLTVSSSGTPNTSISSDTLATIFVQVSQSVPLGSSVVDWNFPHTPPLATAGSQTRIDREYPLGTWALIDSVANTTHHWSKEVTICKDSLNFRVHIPDASGCISTSNAAGAMFQDITPPSIPNIVNVTVDTTTNQTVVHWDPSPELDTDGYIIVLSTPSGNMILDTLYGRLNTTFTWLFSDAGAGPESYTIAAIDTCWKGTPPSPNTSAAHAPHTTVYLSTVYDRCAGTILVQRTPYVGWPVDHYELYAQLDHSGPVNLVATLDPSTGQYLIPNVIAGHTYCFVLKAIGTDTGKTSLSNMACRTTSYPPVPQWNYLRTATLLGKDHVQVTDSVDLVAYTKRLVLQRSYNGLPWMDVASVLGGTGAVVTFEDLDVLTSERSYTYRVLVEDSCGNSVVTSNKGTTILLAVSPDLDGFNRLRWNGYVQWAGTVAGYEVYRSIADGPFELIGITAMGMWEFADDVQGFASTPGKFCYYVVANETGNASGIDAVSVSNIACAIQQEEVWIPNAFIEGGYNNTFQPVLSYADVDRYEFTIFNRWGQQIWTTTDRYQAWDGRVDGRLVPQGVYAYYCSFLNGNGKTVERRGTVTFLPGN